VRSLTGISIYTVVTRNCEPQTTWASLGVKTGPERSRAWSRTRAKTQRRVRELKKRKKGVENITSSGKKDGKGEIE
jgi:hypothetical protein